MTQPSKICPARAAYTIQHEDISSRVCFDVPTRNLVRGCDRTVPYPLEVKKPQSYGPKEHYSTLPLVGMLRLGAL